jgi:predicted dehydrogenase
LSDSLVAPTGIALLGCGYVADYYMLTLANHPELRLCGAFDISTERRSRFCSHWQVRAYPDYQAMLADPAVVIIVNLTPPEHHFATSQAALMAGRHVYSEKPLAMALPDAQALVALASERGLSLSGAPCSVLGDAAQALSAALARGDIGAPKLAYAEMEDAMVFRENWRDWRSLSGAPWPGSHEFEVGCTLEHAGYWLTWLVALFGPVTRMTAFASTCFPDKGTGAGTEIANDVSIACMEHANGTVSRLTCGLVAGRDRSLAITGETGTLTVADGWDIRSTIRLRRERWHPAFGLADKISNALELRLARLLPGRIRLGKKQRLAGLDIPRPAYPSRMDFMGGVAEQAKALRECRPSRLPAEFVLHITELALAMQQADTLPQPYVPVTGFKALT